MSGLDMALDAAKRSSQLGEKSKRRLKLGKRLRCVTSDDIGVAVPEPLANFSSSGERKQIAGKATWPACPDPVPVPVRPPGTSATGGQTAFGSTVPKTDGKTV